MGAEQDGRVDSGARRSEKGTGGGAKGERAASAGHRAKRQERCSQPEGAQMAMAGAMGAIDWQ